MILDHPLPAKILYGIRLLANVQPVMSTDQPRNKIRIEFIVVPKISECIRITEPSKGLH